MAQLVTGVERTVQSGFLQALLDHIMDRIPGHPGMAAGEKKGVRIGRRLMGALLQPVVQGGPAGVVEKQNALLVTLTQNADLIFPYVGHIQGHQLRDSQAAVEEERQDAVIPGPIGLVHRFQELDALIQLEITGQRFFQPGGVQVLHGIVPQKLGFAGQVFVERADGGDLTGPAGRIEAAVPIQIVHKGVDIAEGHGTRQIQIDVVNGNGFEIHVGPGGRAAFELFDKAEKGPKVQIVFVHRFDGVTLYGAVVS